jgi:hypothetical protein
MSLRPVFALLAFTSVISCTAAIQDAATSSGFVTPQGPFGSIENGMTQTLFGLEFDADGEGYAYQSGSVPDEGLTAVSGLLVGTNTRFWPGQGSATFSGAYEMAVVSAISLNDGTISGLQNRREGDLTLTADFAGHTLRGRSSDGLLQVRGEMDGRFMSGSVVYDGVVGDLQGRAGSDQAFGVFHGNNLDLIYAGGFIADRD